MAILNEAEIDPEELRAYLSRLLLGEGGDALLRDSQFRKMTIILDFVKYRYGKSPDLTH